MMTEQNGLERSNATDELCRMLDELRNLASDVNEAEIRSHSVINLTQGRYSRRFVLDMNHDWLNAWHAKFERILQAIAATLGTGTCHMELREDACTHAYQDAYECSKCGEWVLRETFMGESEPPRFCPNCGRRVVSE